jgi:Interleukin-like EMT inducer/Putative binding domain, N-terminal/Glycosyl hydrolases family 2, TIM barrel domain
MRILARRSSLPRYFVVSVFFVSLLVAALTWQSNAIVATHAQLSFNHGPSIVTMNGRQLIVSKRNLDGTLALPNPYIIRGVAWSPATAATTDNNNSRRTAFASQASTDAPLIAGMNANTVRTYLEPSLDAAGLMVLDQLYSKGIMVILTVDGATNDMPRLQETVNFYKNHPAVLMWLLGNEWNINLYYGTASSVADAAQRTQNAAALIKTLDTNHPVASSLGDIDINETGKRLSDTQHYVNDICTSVDVWGINVYRGSNFGTLFGQWQSIATKPMFIGEFGTDAFHTTNYPPLTCPLSGIVDEAAQASWNLNLWNDLYWNLSALYPNKVALGGTLFEWNDEWWKVAPAGSQQNCGHDKTPGGHPDIVSNEEYYGLVDIDRNPRQVYNLMQAAFDAAYQPPATTLPFKAVSAGGLFGNFAQFLKDNVSFYRKSGGGGGGRGFNVAVIDPCTRDVLQPVRNFDTWGSRDSGVDRKALVDFLNSLPNGAIILIAVGDEAGLNNFPETDGCSHLERPWITECFQTLEGLGSQQIRNYCYRGSWAMISIKGQSTALAEQLSNNGEVSVHVSVAAPASISPRTQTFAATGGTGNVTVASATSCSWTTLSDAPWLTVTSSSTGNGNGTVSFSVAANTGANARTGSILISGQTFTVTQAAVPPAPVLLIDETSGRAAALDSVLLLRDPLSIINLHNFSLDQRTRLSLFATNIDLNPGENISAISAQAEDSQQVIHPLTVEFVGKVPNFDWLTQINIRLPDSLANSGDMRLSISLRGVPSNQVLFRLKP